MQILQFAQIDPAGCFVFRAGYDVERQRGLDGEEQKQEAVAVGQFKVRRFGVNDTAFTIFGRLWNFFCQLATQSFLDALALVDASARQLPHRMIFAFEHQHFAILHNQSLNANVEGLVSVFLGHEATISNQPIRFLVLASSVKASSLTSVYDVVYNLIMYQERQINGIQASILRQLFSSDGLRFAQINVDGISSDQFSYHLRQLARLGLIEKTAEQAYRLTRLGRSQAIMLNPDRSAFIQQGFLAVRIILSKLENGQRYYLMQKRTKVPYKGTYATPGDKILFGEDIGEAAVRAMQLHTGLTCKMALLGMRHLKDVHDGEIVQDKYFFVFRATEPQGELIKASHTGENLWITYEELEASGQSIQSGLELLKMADSSALQFDEQTLRVDSY